MTIHTLKSCDGFAVEALGEPTFCDSSVEFDRAKGVFSVGVEDRTE